MKEEDPYKGYRLYSYDTKASFIEREGRLAGTTFAVLMNGNWYERGSDEDLIPSEERLQKWHTEFHSHLEKIPDDAVLTLVDCDI
jgi:hypothetical protein